MYLLKNEYINIKKGKLETVYLKLTEKQYYLYSRGVKNKKLATVFNKENEKQLLEKFNIDINKFERFYY